MPKDSIYQELIFMKAIASTPNKVSSADILAHMKEIAVSDFDDVSFAEGPRRLIRLIDDAERDHTLEAVSLDRWISTPRAAEFQQSLENALANRCG